jgi:hypothetical protein
MSREKRVYRLLCMFVALSVCQSLCTIFSSVFCVCVDVVVIVVVVVLVVVYVRFPTAGPRWASRSSIVVWFVPFCLYMFIFAHIIFCD